MDELIAFRNFLRAFTTKWFVAMSGGLSVPLAVASFFVAPSAARIGLGMTAVMCFVFAAYRVWSHEYKRVIYLQEQLTNTNKLQILYDADDTENRFVRYRMGLHGVRNALYWVGLLNVSEGGRTLRNVSLRALDGDIVEHVFLDHGASRGREPIIFGPADLHPGAIEWVLLFGMAPNVGIANVGDIFASKQQFSLEARGEDMPAVRLNLQYGPVGPPHIRRIS